MELSDFPKAVAGIIVAVIVVVSLAIPIFADYNDQQTFDNENPRCSMSVITSATTDKVIVIDDETGAVTLDGTAMTPPTTGGTYRAVVTNDLYVYMPSAGGTISSGTIIYYNSGIQTKLLTNIDSDLTITLSGTTITCVYSTSGTEKTVERTFEWCAYIDDAGDYSEYKVNSSSVYYVSNVDDMYYTSVDNSYADLIFGHGLTYEVNGVENTADITQTAITNISGVVKATAPSIKLADGVTSATPAVVIVPTEVTGTDVFAHQYKTILEVIPILLVIGIVLGAVTLIRIRKQ